MFDINILKNEEKIIFSLRSLYAKYGYRPYKMGKFEEYELYSRNKDFLVSDNIITFNDTDGRLLALKPDVTLSIIKNSKDETGCVQKVYYNENVYRVSPRTRTFKEIMQTGLECIGDIDIYSIMEVINLAAESLYAVSPDFVLDISHMGILTGIIDESCAEDDIKMQIVRCITQKNMHDLRDICTQNGISQDVCEKLCAFTQIYGDMKYVLDRLKDICTTDAEKSAYEQLECIYGLLNGTKFEDNIHFDFSIANDMNYYNGIVFKGFVSHVPDSVLSGGQYDTLMHKMGRRSGAIGFAVYLDVLEQLNSANIDFDVDVLLLYDKNTDTKKLVETIESFTDDGKSVSAQKAIPQKLRYKQLVKLNDGGRE